MTITKEQARAVRDSMSDTLHAHKAGNVIRIDENTGDWYIRLFLQKKLPKGTFPEEKDGVKIVQEIIGPIILHKE